MQNYLLYHATGSLNQLNECRYALIKYLSVYNLKPPSATSVAIYTDRPAFFEAFAPYFDEFKMELPTGLSKSETINNALNEFEGNLLFCDTNTYPVMPLEILFTDLENGKLYLYNEVVKNDASTNMIIGLNSINKKHLQELIVSTQHTIQIDAQLPEVKNAQSFFRHYRDLPEFKKLLQSFFTKNEEENIPNLIKATHYFDAQQILNEKKEYHDLPFFKKWVRIIKGNRCGRRWF